MSPRRTWDRIRPTIKDCLSRTDAALVASSKRMFEAMSTTARLDVAEDSTAQQLAAQRMRLATLNPT